MLGGSLNIGGFFHRVKTSFSLMFHQKDGYLANVAFSIAVLFILDLVSMFLAYLLFLAGPYLAQKISPHEAPSFFVFAFILSFCFQCLITFLIFAGLFTSAAFTGDRIVSGKLWYKFKGFMG